MVMTSFCATGKKKGRRWFSRSKRTRRSKGAKPAADVGEITIDFGGDFTIEKAQKKKTSSISASEKRRHHALHSVLLEDVSEELRAFLKKFTAAKEDGVRNYDFPYKNEASYDEFRDQVDKISKENPFCRYKGYHPYGLDIAEYTWCFSNARYRIYFVEPDLGDHEKERGYVCIEDGDEVSFNKVVKRLALRYGQPSFYAKPMPKSFCVCCCCCKTKLVQWCEFGWRATSGKADSIDDEEGDELPQGFCLILFPQKEDREICEQIVAKMRESLA